jgi:hypothetical protein
MIVVLVVSQRSVGELMLFLCQAPTFIPEQTQRLHDGPYCSNY